MHSVREVDSIAGTDQLETLHDFLCIPRWPFRAQCAAGISGSTLAADASHPEGD